MMVVIVLGVLTVLFTLEYIRILKECMVRDYEIEIERCITSDNEEDE